MSIKCAITALLRIGLLLVLTLTGCGRLDTKHAELSPDTHVYPAPIAETVVIDYPAPSLGVLVDHDMKVLYVEPGSLAEQAHIQPGDILELNAKQSFRAAHVGESVRLRLRRDDTELQVDVALTLPNV